MRYMRFSLSSVGAMTVRQKRGGVAKFGDAWESLQPRVSLGFHRPPLGMEPASRHCNGLHQWALGKLNSDLVPTSRREACVFAWVRQLDYQRAVAYVCTTVGEV